MMMIGFIGTPSCGKSTTAFGLCYRLKKAGYPVELIVEHARRRVVECRREGISGNGGTKGQSLIYETDCANIALYREYGHAVSIMDGSTLNGYFYGLDPMDFDTEIARYDLLFYIPTIAVPPAFLDSNRMQSANEILEMAGRWETVIRPLMQKFPQIVELTGYPHADMDGMVAEASNVVLNMLGEKQKLRAAA